MHKPTSTRRKRRAALDKKRSWAWENDVSIFAFDNYRKVISSYIKAMRMRDSEFSFDVFTKETGHKSRGYIANVISGKKKASTASILAIARVMALNEDETRYFVHLANLENAENIEVRMFYDRELKRDIEKYLR